MNSETVWKPRPHIKQWECSDWIKYKFDLCVACALLMGTVWPPTLTTVESSLCFQAVEQL